MKTTPYFDFSEFGRILAGRMKHHKMTLRTAALVTCASPSTLMRAADGKPVHLQVVVRVCDWLGVSIDAFVKSGGK